MERMKEACFVVALALMTSGGLSAASRGSLPRSVTPKSPAGDAGTEGRMLLSQIEDHALAISKEVGPLNMQARISEGGGWMESSTLNEVRDDVNAIGKDWNRLVELRTQLEPWEQQEIDRIAPLAVEISDATNDGIRTFNANRTQPWNAPLSTDLTTLSNKADELSKSVNQSLELAKLNKEIVRVEHKS